MLRSESARSAAIIFLTRLENDTRQLESLRVEPHPDMDQIRLVKAQIEASSRTLRLLGVDKSMLNVNAKVTLMQVHTLLPPSQTCNVRFFVCLKS